MADRARLGALIAIAAVIIIIIGVVFVAFFGVYEPEAREVIKVGILVPLSGVRAEAGEYYKKGLDLALEEINNNPANKYKIELIYEDDEYDPAKGVTGFNKLKDFDRVKYVIGSHGSSVTLAVAPLAEENKIILVTPGSQAAEISQAGDYIFRTQINTAQEVPFWAEYIANRTGGRPLYVLALNTDYGASYRKNFVPLFEERGGKLGLWENFDPKEADYRTYLLKIKAANGRYVMLAAMPKSAGQILKQAEELGIEATFFGTSPVEGEDLLAIGGGAAEGLIYPYPYDDASNVTSMKTYREKYIAKYNERPEMLSANIYDTLHLLSICFEQVGDDTTNVKDCLYGIENCQGASGILSFDENGDVVKPIALKTVKNGQFMPYEE